MSVSGSRQTAAINLDEFERRLRTAGAQPTNMEDPLVELARLVDAARPALGNASPPPPQASRAVPPPPPVDAPQVPRERGFELPRPVEPRVDDEPILEGNALRPAFDDEEPRPHESDFQPPEADDEPVYAYALQEPEPVATQPRRPRHWKFSVGALAVAGVAMIGGAIALRGGAVPGLSGAPPFIAAAQGPTKVQPPSEAAVSSSVDQGTNLLKDTTPPAKVKVVNSEEQPVDLNAQAKADAPAAPPPGTSAQAGAAPIRGTTDTPVVVASVAPAPAMASQFPDPKPVRTVSLRPDGTPIPASEAPPPDNGAQAHAAETPPPPQKPAPKASDTAGAAQPSTPKIDLPIKSSKSSARVVVGKTDTTAPSEGAGEPLPTKIDKIAKTAKAEKMASAEPAAPAAAAQPAETAAATPSGGWAVQLAAPKSESEAKSALAKLNAKYGAALGGSSLSVHKAVVNGETIYRVRVVGLTKPDAAAMCARLKGEGGDCFIAK